jgi:anti-sigma factor RsiW
MTCKEAIDVLADYLDSALTEAQLAQLEEHLKVCDPCVAYFRTYRRTRELAARVERVEMPDGMKARLRQLLQRRVSSDQP